MDKEPRLLVWNYTEEEKKHLDSILAELGAPKAFPISNDQGYLLLKDILHSNKVGDRKLQSDEKVLLFYNIPPKGIYFLMDQFKKAELPRPIYATVTEHSINWTFSVLLEHLVEERNMFLKMKHLKKAKKTEEEY